MWPPFRPDLDRPLPLLKLLDQGVSNAQRTVHRATRHFDGKGSVCCPAVQDGVLASLLLREETGCRLHERMRVGEPVGDDDGWSRGLGWLRGCTFPGVAWIEDHDLQVVLFDRGERGLFHPQTVLEACPVTPTS